MILMPSSQITRSSRRQNASCDQCRHSKRRCLVRPSNDQENGGRTICHNCERLGNPCTFNFANTRSAQRPKRQAGRSAESPLDCPSTTDHAVQSGHLATATSADTITDIPTNGLSAASEAGDEFDLDGCLEGDGLLEPATSSDLPFPCLMEIGHDAESTIPQVPSRHVSRSIVGCSVNSPVRLLNSKSDMTLLDNHLARIYDTITAGSASIFLDCKCNMYTGNSRYRFDDIDLRAQIEPSPSELREPSSSQSLQTTPPLCVAPSSLRKQTSDNTWPLSSSATQAAAQKLTVLGAVRFLDHFSDLYGNILSTGAQRKSDEVLKTVLKVFSFQWLSDRSSSCDNMETFDEDIWTEPPNVKEPKGSAKAKDFVDAWFQARSLINDSKSVRSFRIVYATLLFDTIPIPEEVVDAVGYSGWKHEFLDLGLRKLSTLDAIVRRYCANLGPFSGYGNFIESSLNIVLWFGYLRDTVASLMTSRQCKLPEIPRQSKPAPAISEFLDIDSENNVPDICRRDLAGAFHSWRQIIKIKNQNLTSTNGVKDGIPESVLAITSTMADIDAFQQSYHTLLAYCPAKSTPLSVGSTKFWGMYASHLSLLAVMILA